MIHRSIRAALCTSVLCGLGLTRMGRAIRYVPYPVVGGFLGATGLLIVLGAIRVITDHPVQVSSLPQFANAVTLSELAAACAMALVLYLTWHRSRGPFSLPIILFGGVVGQLEGSQRCGPGTVEITQIGQQLRPGGVEQVVVGEPVGDLVQLGQRRHRSGHVAERDRVVEPDHG